ncbi:MAG TPA: hypothetical protein VGP64_12885 [Polyangia bacterium]|jgi:hypothetical protein
MSASPRFRQDLAVSPTEADGVACVDVRDPKTGANFRLYDFEYQLALQLDGQPVQQVTDWAAKTYGADLTADGIHEFAARLRELGFLEADAPPPAAAVTAEVAVAPILAAAAAAEENESAVDEWASPQGAKTATFVPDPGMLDSPPELTPVAPLDLARLAAPEGAPTPIAPEITRQAIAELPSDALDSEPVPAPSRAPAPPVPAAPRSPTATETSKPSWATDLDGALQASDSPAAVAPLAPPRPEVSLPALPGKEVVSPPAGAAERRQPPAPDSVVMSGFADGALGSKPRRRTGLIVVVWLLLLAAAAGAAYGVWGRQHAAAKAPQALRVRVTSPAPSAVYRWFSGRGRVTDYETQTLAFANPGRLAELLPAGTEVAAGEPVAKLVGAAGLETLLAHDRSRVGFYKQLRDSMHAAGNRAEERQAELHLGEKQKLVEIALAGLGKYTVVAPEPGEVVETLAKIGMPVGAGAPIARVKGRLLHGAFELDAEERAALAKMDFCRVEVVGLGPRAANDLPRGAAPKTAADSSPADAQVGPRFFDCKLPSDVAAAGSTIEIPLPSDVGLVSGQPLRLARGRYDAVFPVPPGAVVADGERKSVWVAGRDGTAERRTVTVAEGGDDALVTDGLRVGDQVIVDPPAGLRNGARVEATPDGRP